RLFSTTSAEVLADRFHWNGAFMDKVSADVRILLEPDYPPASASLWVRQEPDFSRLFGRPLARRSDRETNPESFAQGHRHLEDCAPGRCRHWHSAAYQGRDVWPFRRKRGRVKHGPRADPR